MRPRVAVVLFNLGGPDRPEAIRPFLVNIFTDPAILRVPFFVRPLLARRIAAARLEPARAAYAAALAADPSCFPRIVNSLSADATGELWLDFKALRRSLTTPMQQSIAIEDVTASPLLSRHSGESRNPRAT